ncbi:MAG: deoxynucleoside kinase [candidate division Zixibacteria bacterium]|nr:deoxynucleoside kinase [candidate division Zixibacteria bacterium]
MNSPSNLSEPRYIAVEGVIGVGKTSFAKALAEKIDARLELEDGYENPFLKDFYRDRERYAFATQVFFLLSRFQHQQSLRSFDLFNQRIVTDYLFARDAPFASVILSERELKLYEKVAPILEKDIPKPDLVIYLQASTAAIMARIKIRDVDFERSLDEKYIEKLNDAYNFFFFHYTDTPLLVVKTDNIDFVNNSSHLDDLVEQVRKPGSGKRYYTPASGLELDYK